MDAVTTVRNYSNVTRCDNKTQKSVTSRIDGYPGKITESLHRAHVIVPAAVAVIVKDKPSLLASAVQAFYHREAADLKACRAMKYFPPETCVKTCVTFTKCLYAQLVQQRYQPDKRTGWNLPPPASELYRASDVGLKLACGFEILAARGCSVKNNNKENGEVPTLADVSHDIRWNRYINTLTQKGFFKGELEGSVLYKELLEKALQYYCDHMLDGKSVHTDQAAYDVAQLVNNLYYDMDKFRKEAKNLPPPDDESWLEVSPEKLDEMLKEKFRLEDAEDSQELTDSLRLFLGNMASYEGAEISPEKLRKFSRQRKESKLSLSGSRKSSMNDSLRKASNTSTMSTLSDKVNFDSESFSDAMHHILDFSIEEDGWHSDSDMSGYSDEEDERELDEEMSKYMNSMDKELSKTTLGESFIKKETKLDDDSSRKDSTDSFSDVENFTPVDVDMNAVKNFLASYKGANGNVGPVQTLLNSMKNGNGAK